MNSFIYRKIPLLILLSAITSCATGPSRAPEPVRPGQLYEGRYINIHSPNSDGWYLLGSSQAGMAFARSGSKKINSFAAQVQIFPLPEIKSEKNFMTAIEQGITQNTDTSRFDVLKKDLKTDEQRPYWCVTEKSIIRDRKARTSPATTDELLLQTFSLYCRHPERLNTGFRVTYSYRGKDMYPNLEAEARDFIRGVQVPGYKQYDDISNYI